MVLVRNIFRLKYGKAQDAVLLWKEALDVARENGARNARVLTDLTGDAYTLVFEATHDSLADWEQFVQATGESDKFREWYPRFVPLVESGSREIFSIIE